MPPPWGRHPTAPAPAEDKLVVSKLCEYPYFNPVLLQPPDVDLPDGGAHPQNRTSAVQRSLGRDGLRAVVSAFLVDRQAWKRRLDACAVGLLGGRVHVHSKIARQIYHDIARCRVQRGIPELAASGDELHRDR